MKRTAIALLAALIATPAFAHAHLIEETPAAKAVVTVAPSQLTLKFSESVELKFTGIVITGPNKAVVAQGAETVDTAKTLMTVALKAPLAAGTYTVTWHALSTDGHKTNGTYSFTVKI